LKERKKLKFKIEEKGEDFMNEEIKEIKENQVIKVENGKKKIVP